LHDVSLRIGYVEGMKPRYHPLQFSRRAFVLGSLTTLAWSRAKSPACTLTPEQEEGPFYLDDRIVRREITEGKIGVPLRLRIALADARSCAPLAGAAVDIWHCDALGVYSGFNEMSPGGPSGGRMPPPPPGAGGPPPMPHAEGGRRINGARYLRGVQFTDAEGRAEFSTLYPGWYLGRTIHIHLKVHVGSTDEGDRDRGGRVCHTGQLFFPEETTAHVARLEPYVGRTRVPRTLQNEDGVFRGQDGAASILALTRLDKRTFESGFLAAVTLAVDPDAAPATIRPFGPGAPSPDRR
jgi:protocatechuate 3,4-dioxygenase beta subunit